MARRRPEPRRLPARAAQIIAAARELLESEGREALTMRRLGELLGIRAPSIYKHLPGKHAVEVALMEAGFAEIGEALHRAVAETQSGHRDTAGTEAQCGQRSGAVAEAQPGHRDTAGTEAQPGHEDGAIAALMATYRAECLARPNLYRLTTTGRLPRGELTPGLEEWAGEPWVLVAGDYYLAQAMWSFAHGMVILELDRRYPDGSDLDRTWRAGAEAFTLAAQGAAPATAPQGAARATTAPATAPQGAARATAADRTTRATAIHAGRTSDPRRGEPVITVIGEALIDLVDEGSGRYQAHPGGFAANVAVALARLGAPCSILARVSGDALGRQLTAHLASNGVSLRDVAPAAEATTLALASLDSDARASYSFYANGTADWQWTTAELPDVLAPDVQALHAGSLALALEPGAQAIEKLLAAERTRGQVTISIDPNIRPALAAPHADELARVERQLALAHVVKASDEDAAWLYPGVSAEDVAHTWQRLGPRIVVITLGERGAYALGPDGAGQLRPARPARIVDTVGAGDAFCAALLDAMSRRGLLGGAGATALGHLTAQELAELVDWSLLVATLTCERAGADPPARDEALRATAAT